MLLVSAVIIAIIRGFYMQRTTTDHPPNGKGDAHHLTVLDTIADFFSCVRRMDQKERVLCVLFHYKNKLGVVTVGP